MNNLQKTVSAISGWDPHNSGARNDYYYELETREEKLEQIKLYAENALDITLTDAEVERCFEYLEKEVESAERCQQFNELE